MQNQAPNSPITRHTTTFYCILLSTIFSLLLILFFTSTTTTTTTSTTATAPSDPRLFPRFKPHYPPTAAATPPTTSIAYYLTGSTGDAAGIFRLLLAVYHPQNFYLLHLDRFAPQSDRDHLALKVESFPVFKAARNVHVVGKPDFAYSRGSSPVSLLLRGASILLRLSSRWDWFINLSSRDYPLLTQDDLLHILSYLPKELNFVNHTSYIGWRESKRLKPIIVDPGLYLNEESSMFYATQKRELPNAYQLFSGPSTSVLNRNFVEFCVLGSDNLPRILLMYLANTPSSLSNYIPTILCNSQEHKEMAINYNLQYASYTSPSKEHPKQLNHSDFDDMMNSGAAFATQFNLNDPILDKIDQQILGRTPGKVVPGGWCLGESNDSCAVWGDASILRPGPGAKRLENRIVELLSNGTFRSQQCIIE